MCPVWLLSALLCFAAAEIAASEEATVLAAGVAADVRWRNLPAEVPYMYKPGAYLGITRPDTFWFEYGVRGRPPAPVTAR